MGFRTMDYSALQRNDLSSYGKTWRDFKCILLHERSQRRPLAVITTLGHCGKGKSIEIIKRSVVAGWGVVR